MTAERYLSAAESWRRLSSGQLRRPASELLKQYTDHGPVKLTEYERFYTWNPAPLQWHLIVINERLEAEVVGQQYESKTEALLALPRHARKHGCVRSR